LGERVPHQISDRGVAELLGRSDPDPIDDPATAGTAPALRSASRLIATFATSPSSVAMPGSGSNLILR
jgi:hypothetical protein